MAKRKRGQIIRRVCLVAAICMFIVSLVQIIRILRDYREGTDTYDKVDGMFLQDVGKGAEEESDLSGFNGSTANEKKKQTQKVFVWDFAKMYACNSDAIGYIRNGDEISYPVLQRGDNEYYLHHLVNGEYNPSGAIFADARIEEGLEADNCIIYGHNMRNGSMFGTLNRYKKEDYGKQHPYIYIYTEKHEYVYRIFAVYTTEADGDVYQYKWGEQETFVEYLNRCRSRSLYEIYADYPFRKTDKIITLSTCTDDGKDRDIVQAVRVETKS